MSGHGWRAGMDATSGPTYRLVLHRATSFRARLFGLHGHAGLSRHEGLYLVPCRAIHTFGLSYAIDVVFLDARHQVLGCRHRLRPWRAACCGAAAAVVELPAGYCLAHPDYALAIRKALATGRA